MLKSMGRFLMMGVALVLLAVMLLYVTLTEAATAQSYTITWTRITQFTDGTLVTTPITYQMYVGAKGAEVKFGVPVTAPPFVVVPTPGPGVTCVYVTATVGGMESVPSAEACATVANPTPNPPGSVTVTVK